MPGTRDVPDAGMSIFRSSDDYLATTVIEETDDGGARDRHIRLVSREEGLLLARLIGHVDFGSCVRLREGETMKYMLLIYGDEHALTEGERKDCYTESTALAQDLHAKGLYVSANPLHPSSTATCLRVRDGKRIVTDGPFAETREQLGGYFLIDANDLDEALAVAARIPMARKGTVEVRPVLEIPGLPD